jgi:hypothetical protein
MIRIYLLPEPAVFESKVKRPGEAFLRTIPNPVGADWTGHEYWREVHDELYKGHRGVCAYCASWSPRRCSPGGKLDYTSIDHYVPKSVAPKSAYEWLNYRLCRTRLNHRKGDFQDVLDPCTIQNHWFMLNFRTFMLRPSPGLQNRTHHAVKATIERLELNDNDYVRERIEVIRAYALGLSTYEQLREKYPFIAHQVEAQDFDRVHLPAMRAFFRKR